MFVASKHTNITRNNFRNSSHFQFIYLPKHAIIIVKESNTLFQQGAENENFP